jgi:hypothetical protein
MRLVSFIAIGCGVAMLVGCASSGERAYYQTRYIPTSGDNIYEPHERSKWTGDKTVYELPSHPPGIEDEHRPSRVCRRPGPQFKGTPIGGYGKYEIAGHSETGLTQMGGWDERPVPDKGTGPVHGYPVSAMANRGVHSGTVEPPDRTYVSGPDTRPRSVTGAGLDRNEAQPVWKLGDRPKDDYCLPKPLNE